MSKLGTEFYLLFIFSIFRSLVLTLKFIYLFVLFASLQFNEIVDMKFILLEFCLLFTFLKLTSTFLLVFDKILLKQL